MKMIMEINNSGFFRSTANSDHDRLLRDFGCTELQNNILGQSVHGDEDVERAAAYAVIASL